MWYEIIPSFVATFGFVSASFYAIPLVNKLFNGNCLFTVGCIATCPSIKQRLDLLFEVTKKALSFYVARDQREKWEKRIINEYTFRYAYNRQLKSEHEFHLYRRDQRLTGDPYVTAGLENIPDE